MISLFFSAKNIIFRNMDKETMELMYKWRFKEERVPSAIDETSLSK